MPIKEETLMKYISVEEAGKKLNLSARSIRNYCAQGRIPGAVLNGKTWFIPSDATKPSRTNKKEDLVDAASFDETSELINFINNSPVSFLAIDNVSSMLKENGFIEHFESNPLTFKKGDKLFLKRNDSTLLAISIGEKVNEKSGCRLIASHADSPCFKIKPECDSKTDAYNKINVAPYGGMIAPSWLDRPLAVAGRVIFKNKGFIETRLVNLKDLTMIIPNLCIHFNRDINKGYEYNMAVDMQAFFSTDKEKGEFKEILSKYLEIKKEDIVNFDLYLYNKENGIIWGERKEFVSSPRLDDLECVYTSLKAFINSKNENSINIFYVSDNEEVGSLSRQGADSDFLKTTLRRLARDLKMDYETITANSFLVSADNAHAVHPNKPGITDADNKVYLNKGIVIKFNASQSYTSDAISSAVFQNICDKAHVPYQFFTNRSDLRGGSTLGSILLSQVSLMSVDVGLAQLAMHSSYETAGSIDVKYAVKVFKEFYEAKISFKENKVLVE